MSKNKTRTKDKYRVVYNDTQRIELENEFRLNEYIAIPRKQEIAHKLQLSERQIKIWFQNRRAKKRKQQKRRQSAVSTTTATSTNTTTASPGTTTPISAKHESVSPPHTLYPTIYQHNKINNSTTSSASLKSPELATAEQRLHYQSESIYHNQFLAQPQQHQQAVAPQYYEPAANYAQDQEQYAKSSAISMQTNHQRHNFNASWSAPTGVGVNPLVSPHQVAASPQLITASPPTAQLTNQHFHHQHHHHQQSISPYSHHNATSYLAAQTNGYVMSGSQIDSTISQSAHRLHADSGALHQHFMGQQGAPAPTHHHHHSPHPHNQIHAQQHYSQPLTQMQSQNHLHHHHNQLGMSSSCNGVINI